MQNLPAQNLPPKIEQFSQNSEPSNLATNIATNFVLKVPNNEEGGERGNELANHNERRGNHERDFCQQGRVYFNPRRSTFEESETGQNEINFNGNTVIVRSVLSFRVENRNGRAVYLVERTNFEISIKDVETMLFNDFGICTSNVEGYFRNNPNILKRFYNWVIEQHRNKFGNRSEIKTIDQFVVSRIAIENIDTAEPKPAYFDFSSNSSKN